MLTVLKNWRNNECVVLFSFGVCMANLEDVIDVDYGLQQDEWCLTRPRFGPDNQLEIIGWSGKTGSNNKYYIVKCHVCCLDPELFGEGVFKNLKCSLVQNCMPCGCAVNTQWSKQQVIILVERKAKFKGYLFKGIVGNYTNLSDNKCRCEMVCSKHGAWEVSVANFLNAGTGCPICARKLIRVRKDAPYIAKFMSTGCYEEGTIFTRNNDRLSKRGRPDYWNIYCPRCDSSSEADHSALLNGQRSCLCSNVNQKQAYINIIKSGSNILAIKFGICSNYVNRVRVQRRHCTHWIDVFGVWKFTDRHACRAAETECKKTFECSIISRDEMIDGYTETTCFSNLNEIISIYEKHGGVRLKI